MLRKEKRKNTQRTSTLDGQAQSPHNAALEQEMADPLPHRGTLRQRAIIVAWLSKSLIEHFEEGKQNEKGKDKPPDGECENSEKEGPSRHGRGGMVDIGDDCDAVDSERW